MLRHVYAYLYVGPAKDLVMGLMAHDQTFAVRVDLKEITERSSIKEQAGAEDTSADASPRINISNSYLEGDSLISCCGCLK